jgi:putative PIN family toxin of toxin-antitoxin system
VVTTEILLEYEEQLSIFYSPEFADLIIKVFINLPNVVKVQPISFNWQLIYLDADDNKFVDAYIASNADIIVSNDRHFQELKKISFPEISVCKLEDVKID